MTDRILAWLCAEDDGAKKRIGGLLGKAGGSLKDVGRTLKGKISRSPLKVTYSYIAQRTNTNDHH